MRICNKKWISVVIASMTLTTNCVFAHSLETNFWKERQQKNDHVAQYASLPMLPGSDLPSTIDIPKANLFHSALANTRGIKKLSPTLVSILNSSHGQLRRISVPKQSNGRTVIVMQDIHQNVEAQTQLSLTLQNLFKKQQIQYLGLEGSADLFHLDSFYSFEQPLAVQKAANYLLERNQLSGPVHAALVTRPTGVVISGVDSTEHHSANVKAYLDSLSQNKKVHNSILTAKTKLAEKKKHTFNPALIAFDEKAQRYHDGSYPLNDYLALLQEKSDTIEPLFETFIEASRIEKSINFQQVERERSELIRKLVERNDATMNRNLTAMSLAFKEGSIQHEAFYSFLKNTLNQSHIPLHAYKAMDTYIQYILFAESINPENLMVQVTRKEKDVYAQLAQNQEEKDLVEESKALYLSEKLVDFSLTRNEWNEYKTFGGRVNMMPLHNFESFYNEAEIRDQKIAGRMIADMTANQALIGALVCGGFHSEGIITQLTQAGFTAVTFVPRTTKLDMDQGSSYLGIFAQQKTPLEQLFQGEKLFLAANPKGALGTLVPLLVGLGSLFNIPVTKSLSKMAPSTNIVHVNVEHRSAKEADVTFEEPTKKTEVHVEVNEKFDILRFTSTVMANTNFLAGLITVGVFTLKSIAFSDQNLFIFINTFLLVRLVLMTSAFFEEFSQMMVNGYFDHKAFAEWPQTFFSNVLKNNFNLTSILLGTELHQISFKVKNTSDAKHVTVVGLTGPLSNLFLTVLGSTLILFPSAQSVGLVLVLANLLFFIINFTIGSDGYAIRYGKCVNGLLNCGIFGFFMKKRQKEDKFNFHDDKYNKWMHTSGTLTQKRGAQSAGIAKQVIIPVKRNYIWMLFRPYLALQFFLFTMIGAFQLPNLATLDGEGLTFDEIKLARKGYFLNERGENELIPSEHRRAHVIVRRLNNRRSDLLNRLMDYNIVMMEVAKKLGYEIVDDYESEVGHTRYATGSMTKLKNAHPHGSRPRLVKRWVEGPDGNITERIMVHETDGVHNGDFNGTKSPDVKVEKKQKPGEYSIKPILKIFQKKSNGRYPGTGDVRHWLERMGEKISAEGDTPVYMAFINFLTGQGMWYQSAKIAYQFTIAESLTDEIPSKENLQLIADRTTMAYQRHFKDLYPIKNVDVDAIDKRAIPAFLADIRRALNEITFTKNWTTEKKDDFAEIMLQVFLYNDVPQATKFVTAIVSEDTTLGLSLDSTHKPNVKVLTAHNKLPMAIIYDPSKGAYFYGSDHNAVKANADFETSKIIYLRQQDREVATISPNGITLYSNTLKRELTAKEIEARWVLLKDNSYITPPDLTTVINPLEYDVNRIPEESLKVHNSWDPTRSEYDKRNIATAEHLVDLIGHINDEKKESIDDHRARGKPLNGTQSLTPDILFIGTENNEVALRQLAGTMKPRMLSSLYIRSMSANEFNHEWVDPDKRHLLLGQNTIVVVMSMSGLTFMSVDATEASINIKKKENDQKLSEFAENLPEDVKPHFLRYVRSIAENGKGMDLPQDDVALLKAIKLAIGLLEDKKQLKDHQDMLQTMAELEKIRRSRTVREVFTITNGWDNEMTRLQPEFDLNNPTPPNNIFVIGAGAPKAEASSLSIVVAHQFLTELQIYLADQLRKTGKSVYLGFKLSAADIEQMKANNRVTVEKIIPFIVGRFKKDDAKVDSKVHQNIIQLSKRWAQNFNEGLYVDIAWKVYVWLTVFFSFTLFSNILPFLAGAFNSYVPVYGQIAFFASTLLLPLSLALKSKNTKWLRIFIYPLIFSSILFIFTLGQMLPFNVSPTTLYWLAHAGDATFYISGFYLVIYTLRFAQGREVFARIHGSRVLMFADDPGVIDYLFVTAGKAFSQGFGHLAPNVRKADFTNRGLMEESHNLPRGSLVIEGITDGRRPILQRMQNAMGMGANQVKYTINALLHAGPEIIAMSNDPNAGKFNFNITLPDDAGIIEQDNRSPNADSLNMIIEERFLQLHRIIGDLVFVSHMYTEMATSPIGKILRWFGIIRPLMWRPESQNLSMNLTTASPNDPIPSPQSFVLRDLIPIAERLAQQSENGEISPWVPSRKSETSGMNLAALLDAAVYNEGGPTSAQHLRMDEETPSVRQQIITPAHLPAPPSQLAPATPKKPFNVRKWIWSITISLLLSGLVIGTLTGIKNGSFDKLKSQGSSVLVEVQNFSSEKLGKVKIYFSNVIKNFKEHQQAPAEPVVTNRQNTVTETNNTVQPKLGTLVKTNTLSSPSGTTESAVTPNQDDELSLSHKINNLRFEIDIFDRTQRETDTQIAELQISERELGKQIANESDTDRKTEFENKLKNVRKKIEAAQKSLGSKAIRDEKVKQIQQLEEELKKIKSKEKADTSSLTNAVMLVSGNPPSSPTDITARVLTALSQKPLNYELNSLSDQLRPTVEQAQNSKGKYHQALLLGFMGFSLRERALSISNWFIVLNLIFNLDKSKVVVFNIGENPNRLTEDFAHAGELLKQQTELKTGGRSLELVFLIHGSEEQQSLARHSLQGLEGIHNSKVSIIGRNANLISEGLIDLRKVLQAAAELSGKNQTVIADILNHNVTAANAQLVNLTKFPGNFGRDAELVQILLILEEVGSTWNAFGPKDIEKVYKAALAAAKAA